MSTSIITPLFNHLTDLTIPFIERAVQTKGKWELILVDNASVDGTWEYIKKRSKRDKRIKVIHNDKNQGFGGGNNTGYRRAVMPQICFISNDVVINDFSWLEKFSQVLKDEPKSLIGPQLVTNNTLTNYKNIPTSYLTGHCIFGSKELFDKVSRIGEVWDESFGVAYFEDVWLSVQALDLGYQLKEVPVDLNHLGSKSSDQFDISEQTKKTQIIFHDKMTRRELKQKQVKRIIFFAPDVPYEFNDYDYEGKGVGGAEASLILLARELARLGHMVEVYNKNEVTGKFNGVEYHHVNEFIYTDYCDVFILFRSYHPVIEVVNASKKLFWSCDQTTNHGGIWDYCIFPNVERVICISDYHKEFIEKHYLCKKPIQVIDLGIKWEDYSKKEDKVPGRAIYCSVPRRGLEILARVASVIKSQVPEFNLVITSDYRLWGLDDPDNLPFREMFSSLDYVKFVGKVSRKELVEYQKSSQVMAYPCTYEECFCISAMECMAAGAVPVTYARGALPTTVGEGGVVLSNTGNDDSFVKSIVDLLKNEKKLEDIRRKGYKIAEKHDWKLIVNQWLDLIKDTNMLHNISTISEELGITTGSVKRLLNIPYIKPNSITVGDIQVEQLKKAIQVKDPTIQYLEEVRELATKNRIKRLELEKPPETIRNEVKLPIVGMPKYTVVAVKVPVKVSINGNDFVSVVAPSKAYHEVKVPYDYLPSVVQIIKEAYGDVIL